jgi:hypothetical protein
MVFSRTTVSGRNDIVARPVFRNRKKFRKLKLEIRFQLLLEIGRSELQRHDFPKRQSKA